MTYIVPTVTADNPHIYRQEIENVASFVERIHIDFADGIFAPTKLVNPVQAWWPEGMQADVHVMFKQPQKEFETIVALNPDLVVLHAESEGDILGLMQKFKQLQIKVGIALLQSSQPNDNIDLIKQADHVLVFGGKLGYHGGEADLTMLDKIPNIKAINPKAEIAWDGGINDQNIFQLQSVGVDVMNVGGFIQKASSPQDAYDILTEKLKQ